MAFCATGGKKCILIAPSSNEKCASNVMPYYCKNNIKNLPIHILYVSFRSLFKKFLKLFFSYIIQEKDKPMIFALFSPEMSEKEIHKLCSAIMDCPDPAFIDDEPEASYTVNMDDLMCRDGILYTA